MTPAFTVVVPTHNRRALILSCVDSLLRQSFAADRYEIVVVDNACTDGTAAEVEALGDGRVRVIREPRLGASRARNAGWRAARGGTVVFIDDDITVPTDYLHNVERATAAGADVTGGRVVIKWPGPRPRWITDDLLPYLAQLDWRAAAGPLPPSKWLQTSNLAVRREALEKAGGFREDLGPVGSRAMAEEEVELQRQVRKRGGACWYDPAMVAYHHILRRRLTRRWFLSRAFWGGYSLAFTTHEMGDVERSALRRGWSALRGGRPMSVACLIVKAAGFLLGRAKRLFGGEA